ncbi:MAG: hypothetical protein ACLU4J_08055 [Butyricimonas paravirosa]
MVILHRETTGNFNSANGQEIKLDRELELKKKYGYPEQKSGEVVYRPTPEMLKYNNTTPSKYPVTENTRLSCQTGAG